jgi:hypothetical protein
VDIELDAEDQEHIHVVVDTNGNSVVTVAEARMHVERFGKHRASTRPMKNTKTTTKDQVGDRSAPNRPTPLPLYVDDETELNVMSPPTLPQHAPHRRLTGASQPAPRQLQPNRKTRPYVEVDRDDVDDGYLTDAEHVASLEDRTWRAHVPVLTSKLPTHLYDKHHTINNADTDIEYQVPPPHPQLKPPQQVPHLRAHSHTLSSNHHSASRSTAGYLVDNHGKIPEPHTTHMRLDLRNVSRQQALKRGRSAEPSGQQVYPQKRQRYNEGAGASQPQ